MTLRECADSFIQNVTNFLRDTDNQYVNYSGESWNILYSDVAIDYILDSLTKHPIAKKYNCTYYTNNKTIVFSRIKPVKTPISHLGLDNKFTWNTVTLN